MGSPKRSPEDLAARAQALRAAAEAMQDPPKLAFSFFSEAHHAAAAVERVRQQPRMTVRLASFPESNGRRNWTALLVRAGAWDGLVGNCGGVSLARGELWNRVAYHAECARLLIGERDTEPNIMDYGDDISTPEEWAVEIRGGRSLLKNR